MESIWNPATLGKEERGKVVSHVGHIGQNCPQESPFEEEETEEAKKEKEAGMPITKEKPNSNTVGIFAIFLTLVVQTAAIAYWAGGISARQTTFDSSQDKIDQRLQYIQTQNEVAAKNYAKMEGRLDAMEKNIQTLQVEKAKRR